MSAGPRDALVALLDEVLASGLPADWPEGRPLVEAGLDSVAVLTLVSELEARLGLQLGGADLSAENFGTLGALRALVARRTEGA
ncbi:MAG: acyl carrier protein [Acidobacteria bacterium]|nr:acyl carrier protein [Acidobacteriota bacterium]